MARLLLTWPAFLLWWQPLITSTAARYDLDPALVAAVIWQESAGDPGAIGDTSLDPASYGLMQVRAFGWRPSPAALLDPAVNVDYGSRILRTILDRQGGDITSSLQAYACGYDRGECGEEYAATILLRCRLLGGCRAVEADREYLAH